MRPAIPAILAVTFVLGACVPETTETKPVVPPAQAVSDACGASKYQALIGQTNPAIDIPADQPSRKLTPNSPMTMDYRAERINIVTDKSGKLVRVFCG